LRTKGDCKSLFQGQRIANPLERGFAHDFIMGGESPYFKVLDIKPRWYFYFGSGTGNTLW
jgi:hypothetical protein